MALQSVTGRLAFTPSTAWSRAGTQMGRRPKMAKRKKKAWSASAGDYGHRIRCFEDPTSGMLYAEMRDPSTGRYISRSLRHRDKDAAMVWTNQQVVKLNAGF